MYLCVCLCVRHVKDKEVKDKDGVVLTAPVSDVLLCLIIKLTGVRRLTTWGLSIWGRHVHYDELSTGPSPSESWTLAQNRIREAWIAPRRIFIDLVRLQPQPVKSCSVPSHVSFVRVVEVQEYTEFMELWWNTCEVWGHKRLGGGVLYRAHSGIYWREYTTQQAWGTRDQRCSIATIQMRVTWKLHLLKDLFWHCLLQRWSHSARLHHKSADRSSDWRDNVSPFM